MDIMKIAYAAELFFAMCREHPEICPHDYSLNRISESVENGECVEHYKCNLCGNEYEKIKYRF